MQVLEAAAARTANPWPLRRERAAELAERYPHAEEMLRLYQALTGVQEAAVLRGAPTLPSAASGGGYKSIAEVAAQQILPGIVDATVEAGPPALRDGVVGVFCSADLVELVQRWLDQQPLNPFETYLARASASPLLEGLFTPHPDPPPQGGREKSPPAPQGGRVM
ncbi:MAG: hypothetical protein E6J16_13175, partial [Chloroflexota bacterium]